MSTRFAASAVAVVALCGSAHASVIVTNNQALWNWRVTNGGQVVGTENFNDLADGLIPSATISDVVGNVTWTASASSGLMYANSGVLAADAPDPVTLNFSFSPGVRGVAGNIFGTDVGFNAISCVVSVTLANGTTYEGFSSSTSDFVGFYSTGPDIASLSIKTSPLVVGDVHASIDNLYLAVPAPGAAALIGLAGVASRRRRMR
jgi:hypothetical protein